MHTPSNCPANLNTLTQADTVAYMRYLSVANRRGYTHRRITPDTLARLEDGTAVIAGWLNGDSASGPANTALDKVQLLVLFAASDTAWNRRSRPPAKLGETRR